MNDGVSERRAVRVRGIYGGIPIEWIEQHGSLGEVGVNAVWIGSGSLSADGIMLLKSQGAQVFAEFNTLHEATYLQAHPDAAPVGTDGNLCPPPDGWQGVCPSHAGYRAYRMNAFRSVLREFALDGIWLDYHHSHASWEQAVPNMPDTCFCGNCLARFAQDTGIDLPARPAGEAARLLLGEMRDAWTAWRCGLFTDWVREFRDIVNEERPEALLGTFHCPWSDTDWNGALRDKLAIDLKAQSPFLDVLSIMPYHARFGHAGDPGWISRQVAWLGQYLNIHGDAEDRLQIWPIAQLSDWGETVPPEQVAEVMEHAARSPASGVTVFAWNSLRQQPEKLVALARFYRSVCPSPAP